jgi:hypothetical protein
LFPVDSLIIALLRESLRLLFALLEGLPDPALLSTDLDDAEDQAACNRQPVKGSILLIDLGSWISVVQNQLTSLHP